MPAVERPLIYANLRKPGYTVDIDCYLRNGGYEALKKAVAIKPEEVCKEVEDVRPARPRRRRLPDRHEVEIPRP